MFPCDVSFNIILSSYSFTFAKIEIAVNKCQIYSNIIY